MHNNTVKGTINGIWSYDPERVQQRCPLKPVNFMRMISSFFYLYIYFSALKGVFAKNERGYRLKAKNNRFWSLLILLLSVASKRRNLLYTPYTAERSVHTNSEMYDSEKNQINVKKFIQILQPIVIDYFGFGQYSSSFRR